ncbi:MAG: ABC transporter ATP-binding protein [Opitutales bacterium]|nr:ABC transporter ATP-binding protein [Opitutales bacterium]
MKKLLRFYVYIKPSLLPLIVAVVCGSIFGASSGLMPAVFKYVLEGVFENQGEYGIWYVAGVAAALPLIFAMRAISGYASGYLMVYCSLEVLRRLKLDLFSKMQAYPIAFFDKFTTGDILTRLTNDSNMVQTRLLGFASEIFRQPMQAIGAIAYLIYQCVKSGEALVLIVVLMSVPVFILPMQIIRKNLKRYAGKAQVSLSEMTQHVNENLDAVHEVRVFSLQDRQIKAFGEQNNAYKKFFLKVEKYDLMQQPIMEVFAAILIAATFIYSYCSHIDLPTFTAIGVALYLIVDPIKRVIKMTNDFIKTMPLVDRICEILDYQSEVPEPENPVKVKDVKGRITFENVGFAYKDKTVLKNVSIDIPAGTSCALVGESGAGKSTFAKLAMRLYDPASGRIMLDGVDLRDISNLDYMANLGSVPQYPVLFNDTVFNNILAAKDGATREEVYAAAKAAYADDFIRELENGYETVVGERGDRLSGGQKQRIAIARVFLKNPPIIVLDEATSALDVNSEAFIQQAIDSLMKSRTMFIIAHRFSTIKNVQKIIVFKDGEIIDFGSHSELMSRCAHYKSLYERQASAVS